MNNKDKYRIFCKTEDSLSVFSQDWWLDAVCGKDNWDVCLIEKGRQIQASMPYCIKRKYGLKLLTQPTLTQTLGPWIKSSNGKYSKKLSKQKDLMTELIQQLPDFDYFSQNWNYEYQNWLPFYWNNFKQTTKYTYTINLDENIDTILSNFEQSKRKNIKKSESLINIVFDISAEEFYENHKYTLSKQGENISYSFEIFKRIYDASYNNNAGRTIAAYDRDGNLHAAIFFVWNKRSAYDLISTIDPNYRTHGAASLLIKNILEFVKGKSKDFDFEGSMIESVERSFRQFGAKQQQYFNVYRADSLPVKLSLLFKR